VLWHYASQSGLEERMIEILNTALLREKAIDAANVGDVIYWMGEPLKIDITDDCRKIAYPLVPAQAA
jgi:hypothetical protein